MKGELEVCDGFSVTTVEQSAAAAAFFNRQSAFSQPFVRFQPGGCVMPHSYVRVHNRVRNFKVNEDDIWISSFPKCGTTWTQEMVWNIMNNVDLEAAKQSSLEDRVPFLELTGLLEVKRIEKASEEVKISGTGLIDSLSQAEEVKPPRILKTHLPVELLPREVLSKAKVIYVTRNPRDAVVSLFNHWRIMHGYQEYFNALFDAFVNDVAGYYCPFIQHVLGYWNLRKEKNVLFITFEEMKQDLASVIRRVAGFLDKDLTDDQITTLAGHLDFDSMKNNPAVNKEDVVTAMCGLLGTAQPEGRFMRKGRTGDWRNKLTDDQVRRIEEWEQKHLQGTDLTFTYDL